MGEDGRRLERTLPFLTCQCAKPSNEAKQPLETFNVSGIGPGDLVTMDIATLPGADNTFRYFLCLMDVFA